MAIDNLYKIQIVGLQKDKVRLLDFLHKKGFMHINTVEEIKNDHQLDRDLAISKSGKISESLLDLKWMEEQLGQFSKTVLDEETKKPELQRDLRHANMLAKVVKPTLSKLVHSYNDNLEQIANIEKKIKNIEHIPFDVHKSFFQTEKTEIKIVKTDEDVLGLLDKIHAKVSVVMKEDYAIVHFHKKDKQDVMNQLKSARFIEIDSIEKSTAVDLQDSLIEKKKLTFENEQIKAEIQKLSKKHQKEVKQVYNNLYMFHERYTKTTSFLKTSHTFTLEGYIPIKNFADLKNSDLKVHILEREYDDNPPVKLRNSVYVSKFEFITKMFGLPIHGSLDPTVYLSFFIPIFFGFMFSDIGYGIILLFMSIFMIVKAKPNNKVLKDGGVVMFVSSISTIVFGLLFGSFFGNLFGMKPLLFDPFTNAKSILIISLAIGLVHLNLGIAISIYDNLKKRNYKEFLLSNISILLLELGAAISALGNLPVGLVTLGISAALLVAKNSLMGLMDITGFFGTWFSYARLLALSLATAGIALGINIIGDLFANIPYVGTIVLVLFLIFGHLFNFVLNVLGSTIHSVRLHYIEFFSQFYEAGGKEFKAFTTKKVKETV